MSVKIRNVKDIDQYWERLSTNLSYLDGHLQKKAEYGSHSSERGVQSIVLLTAVKMAKEHNMNDKMVSSLCQSVALCFPEKGLAELSVIKEVIKKQNLNIALDTLEIDAIEYTILNSGSTLTPELDIILRKYYSKDESVPEINLVRFLQNYLNLNRTLLQECSFADSGHVAAEIMKRAKAEYETAYRLLPDPIIQPLPENVKNEIEENVLTFLKYYNDVRAGLYEIITF